MVLTKSVAARAHTTYYLRPGQTLDNTKPSERALALVLPRSAYDALHEKTLESERAALVAEREAKRLAALRQATKDMSKSWQDTAQNVQKRRREELLNRRKVEEAERIRFTKEMAAKNAEERAKVVKQAKELLLQRKPQCRAINRALLVSECYRELETQLEYRRSEKVAQEQLVTEEVRSIWEDVERFRKDEAKKLEERSKKLELYKRDLEEQIKANERNLKSLEESLKRREIEDAKNMSEEAKSVEAEELRRFTDKRERLKRMFLEAIEERKQHELEVQREEEFREKCLQAYRDHKLQTERTAKERARAAREDKIRRAEALGKKFARIAEDGRRAREREDERKDEIDRDAEERRKEEARQQLEEERRKRERARLEAQQEMRRREAEANERRREAEELRLWEDLQRRKRDEFNAEWNLKKIEEEKARRAEYGELLKRQMREAENERKRAAIEADDSKVIKRMIDAENEKVLAFAERTLEESRGTRPIYPIAKAVEEIKREMGLVPSLGTEDGDKNEVDSKPKKRRGRRTFCKPVDEENALYLG